MPYQVANLMMVIGIEWIVIVVVIVMLFVGVKKIPQLAKSFGKVFCGIPKIQNRSK